MKFNTVLKLSIGASVALAVGIPIVNRTSADSVPSLVAGQGNIPRTDVVDVASYQANLSVADFQNMKKAGVKGVIVKLTEGTTYKNPYAATQIANTRTAGLVVGHITIVILLATQVQRLKLIILLMRPIHLVWADKLTWLMT